MLAKIVQLFGRKPRRFHGQCQRCPRVDYLPWATEHGVRYCGHCWERDALSYTRQRATGLQPVWELHYALKNLLELSEILMLETNRKPAPDGAISKAKTALQLHEAAAIAESKSGFALLSDWAGPCSSFMHLK